MKKITVDGNFAAANIAYMFNDVAVIYPITPSSPMAEDCDQFVFENKKNIFGEKLRLVQMQSEAGVAGAVHGSLVAGAKTTTFTSSQGLMLMIPNMYKIAGEGIPCVFYVAARTVATHALNIFCDYSDIYACLKTGFNLVCCSSVQEVNDLAIACEIASLKSSTPFICFFDGFRTSHELNTVYISELEDIKKIVSPSDFLPFKNRAISNDNPYSAGTNQNPDVFMQNRVLALKRYANVIAEFRSAIKKQSTITGRKYATVEYFGDPNAENVVVAMGTSADTVSLSLSQAKGKVGLIKVRLLKPFDEKEFIKLLPKTTKNIAVLERNLDVNGVDTLTSTIMAALSHAKKSIPCANGCFGLGGKEFTPDMALAVFEQMGEKEFFTVGINDDVSHTSLNVEERFVDNFSDFSMRVYGLGSDGSVSSVKNTIKILADETDCFAQGYFDYDSKKSGSLTISHLRSSQKPILAPFNPTKVDLMMCNNIGFVSKYDITDCLNQNGIMLLNSGLSVKKLNEIMPNKMKRDIKEKHISLFTIDANKIATQNHLGGKINTIMQTALFSVKKLIPFERAFKSIKSMIEKSYGKKGKALLEANYKAIENIEEKISKIDTKRLTQTSPNSQLKENDEYFNKIILPTSVQDGNKIPVSVFDESGHMPTDTAKFEKRAIATELPDWISEKCIQCGRCTMMCPHAAIRPVLIDEKENLPANFKAKKAFVEKGNYHLQIDTLNCTGCGVCSEVCPVKALIMKDAQEIRDREVENLLFQRGAKKLTPKENLSVKGVQYKKPYFEFSGACAGCGETPYIKLATQLFGDRMLIANATGCSSIYGGTYPTCPYAKDEDGFGPSWANSLFEDNAEFGYGIAISKKNQREIFINRLKNTQFSPKIQEKVAKFLKNTENHEANKKLIKELKSYQKRNEIEKRDEYLFQNISLITSPSVWIIGGDGWAYDIGFGGLDHVVATGENVNVLILDTEVYSNTGGQTSKSTPRGATAKFNLTGKTTKKKDLASMLMSYKDVYVATVCMGANPEQCVQAFVEAEKYNGPSIIIAYAPCISHGYNLRHAQQHAFNSVKSGYNTLFRYNPALDDPMKVDSFDPTMNYREYVESENRFSILEKVNSEHKDNLLSASENDANERRQTYLTVQSHNKDYKH